jgi:hypothetical protein
MAGLFKGMQMKVFKNSNGEVEVKKIRNSEKGPEAPPAVATEAPAKPVAPTPEASALQRIAGRPDRSPIGSPQSEEARKLLLKKEPLTQDDLKILDERRQALNTEASALKADDPRTATKNKKVELIENSGKTPEAPAAATEAPAKPAETAPSSTQKNTSPQDSVSQEFSHSTGKKVFVTEGKKDKQIYRELQQYYNPSRPN